MFPCFEELPEEVARDGRGQRHEELSRFVEETWVYLSVAHEKFGVDDGAAFRMAFVVSHEARIDFLKLGTVDPLPRPYDLHRHEEARHVVVPKNEFRIAHGIDEPKLGIAGPGLFRGILGL